VPDDRGRPDATLSDPVVSATLKDAPDPMSPSELAGAITDIAELEQARTIPSSAFDPMASLQVGQRLGNRYVVRAFLGQGGMGAVYRATDEKLHDDVALKVVRSAFGTRLREEVRLAQKVTHPNVCRTFDLEDVDGYHLVKMEYVPGETLGALLEREGKLSVERVLTIARALASGLAAAHAQGIVHRDLKPQNVMIAGDRIILMDFGLAQRIDEDDRASVGTPCYMAPEQVAGGAVDERTDLYALGCVVYELLTGARVFTASTPTKVMRDHEQVSPPSLDATLPDAPRWLTRAITLLLSKSPEERPRGLALLLEGPPRQRRSRAAAALAFISIAAVVGAIAVATRTRAWEPTIVPLEPQFDEDGFVAISPDGTKIAYSSDREAPGVRHRVFVAGVPGGDPGRAITPRERDANMPRWTRDGSAVLYTASGVLYRQPIAGGPDQELGPSNGADDCGDAIVILRFAFAGSFLELRAPDGSRTRLAGLPQLPTYQQASAPRCSPTGDRVLFTSGASTPSACIHDVWIVDRDGTARQITKDHRACKAVFAPDGKSLIVSAKRDGKTSLYELPLDGRPERALTLHSGPHVNPDVSADGKLLVFQREVLTSKLEIGDRTSSTTIPVKVGVVDTVTPTRDFSYLIAQRDDPAGGAVIEAIHVVDGGEQVLATGILPFASFDGSQVMFRTVDRGDELRAVPIGGGPERVIARLPGTIALGGAGPDGAHVLVEREGRLEGWRVTPDGKLEDEGAPGLVIPAPSGGWRMVQIPGEAATFRILLIPPGTPLSAPARELTVVSIYNSWIDDHRIAVVRDHQFQIVDATTGEITVVAARRSLTPVSVLAADGLHWATIERVRSVARYAITNFATR